MTLISARQRQLLIENGERYFADFNVDLPPVIKLRIDSWTFLVVALSPTDHDCALGLFDGLGQGPQLECLSISNLEDLKRLGHFVEPDRNFVGRKPLSEYLRPSRGMAR